MICPKYSECCDFYCSSLFFDIVLLESPRGGGGGFLYMEQVFLDCCLVMSVSRCIHDCDVVLSPPIGKYTAGKKCYSNILASITK